MNMQGLTFPDCNTYLVPVGTGDCYAMDKQPKGLIFTTRDFTLDVNGTPDGWANAFEDINNSGTVQYIPEGIVNMEVSGGDLRLSQEGYGPSVVTGLNVYQEVYTVIEGGLCLYKNLLKLHGKRLKVFVIGEDNNVLMTYKEELSFAAPKITKAYFQGFDVNVGVTYRKNNGTNVGAVQITLIYTGYEKEFANASMFKLPRELKQDLGTYLDFVSFSGSSDGQCSATFKLRTSCGGVVITPQMTTVPQFISTSDVSLTPLYGTTTYKVTAIALSGERLSIIFAASEKVPVNVQLRLVIDATERLNKNANYRGMGYLAPERFERIVRISTDI